MTHGDPRGPNIIPYNAFLRKQRENEQPEQSLPWPFNELGPSPYHRATLPPVDTIRIVNAQPCAVSLETEIENAIDKYYRTNPDVTVGQIILALVSIYKDLARALKLPSR